MTSFNAGWIESQGRRLLVRLSAEQVSDLSLDVSVQFSADGQNWVLSQRHPVPIPWAIAAKPRGPKKDKNGDSRPAQESA